MKKEDFYQLHIGQVLYCSNGEVRKIKALSLDMAPSGDLKDITLKGATNPTRWESICEYYSLTPPKKKKRFWAWRIKILNWFRLGAYYDENGGRTDGLIDHAWGIRSWEDLEKQKIEGDFIDVEVDE